MKEKKDCKIVQDLLPNYIENLTSDETNQYINEHLNECEECKEILENMQKDLKVNDSKKDDREVKYIKKFNRKFKLLRNILLIIIIVFLIIIGRKLFIITRLSNKANDTLKQSNYYTRTETYSNGQTTILESYNKDGITSGTMSFYSEGNNKKIIFYKSKTEIISLLDNGESKTLMNMGDITINPVYFTGESILENLRIAITTSIDKVKINGKDCYIIKENDNTEKFIDADTGLAIKMIDNKNNTTVDYKYKFGTVKNTDIVKPDTTEYTTNE